MVKSFANKSLANIKLSKTQLPMMVDLWGRFLGRPLGTLLKTDLSLIKHLPKPLARSNLIPLELTEAADVGIHKKNHRTGGDDINSFKWRNEWYHLK